MEFSKCRDNAAFYLQDLFLCERLCRLIAALSNIRACHNRRSGSLAKEPCYPLPIVETASLRLEKAGLHTDPALRDPPIALFLLGVNLQTELYQWHFEDRALANLVGK